MTVAVPPLFHAHEMQAYGVDRTESAAPNKQEENHALSLLWDCLAEQIRLPPLRNTAKQRQWFTDPLGCQALAGITKLDFHNCPLKVVPRELQRCFNLVMLNLEHTHISTIPEWISDLSNLEKLVVSHTKIQSLPESITKLSHIQEVWAENTLIQDVSPAIKDFFTGKRSLHI